MNIFKATFEKKISKFIALTIKLRYLQSSSFVCVKIRPFFLHVLDDLLVFAKREFETNIELEIKDYQLKNKYKHVLFMCKLFNVSLIVNFLNCMNLLIYF